MEEDKDNKHLSTDTDRKKRWENLRRLMEPDIKK